MQNGGADVDLGRLLAALGRRKWLIVGMALGGLLLAVAYLHLSTPEYRVTLPVISTRADPLGSGGRSASLANLVGAKLGNDQLDNFTLYRVGVHSLPAAENLSKDQQLLRRIFPAEWDDEARAWREPSGPVRTLVAGVSEILGIPRTRWTAPGPLRLQRFLQKEVSAALDDETHVLVLGINAKDPQLGQELLSKLDNAVDAVVRERQLSRAEHYVAYINEQLQIATIPEQRVTLASMLLQQQQQIMMGHVALPFAAERFGPPVPSLGPAKPNGPLTLALGLAAGAFLGLLGALWRERLLSR